MNEQKNIVDQEHKQHFAKMEGVGPQLAQAGFVLFSLFFTVFAAYSVNAYVGKLVASEYEEMSRYDAEEAFEELVGFEEGLNRVATILSMYDHVPRAGLIQKAQNSLKKAKWLDQLLWLYQTEAGAWKVARIYTKDVVGGVPASLVGQHYSLNMDSAFLSIIRSKNILAKPGMSVHTDLKFLSQKISPGNDTVHAPPFALMRAVEPGDSQGGLIIGVGTLAPTFGNSKRLGQRISVRDIRNGSNIYNYDFESQSMRKIQSQAYEFIFGDQKWEIKSHFWPTKQVVFLQSLPLFMIVIGFVITTFGLLYIRSNSVRALQMSSIHQELEEKSSALSSESKKRERLNKALVQAEYENQAIIDAVSDIIFEVDTQGHILFLSASWKRVTGFNPDQSKGEVLFTMLHSQDQDHQRQDFELMVQGKKQVYRAFARLRTADGSFRAVELAFSMMRQDKDKNTRVVGTITDVEERRRAERALSEAEKKYRAIVENAAGGIYQLTPDGVYLSANPSMARILGYDSPEDLLRSIKNANQDIYVDTKTRQSFIEEVERRGSISGFETQAYRKDGSEIWINENIRAVKDDNKNTLYYEGSLEEISIRKKSELAMQDAKVHSDMANRAKSEFLSNMSHELRTPLNAIIGFSEIIKDEAFGPLENKVYAEYVGDIYNSGQNLLRVINEILDISKIEAGERHLNEGLVDLAGVAESSVSMMSNRIESNKVTVSNALENIPQIIGEELAIKQILMNLLSNAIKFTPEGGRVTITADLDKKQQLRLCVTDTGIGLNELEIEKALSPFGQIDSDLDRSAAGTGLGLTLVDALIKLHGGSFELFSQKGIGTTATVIFPPDRVTVKKSTTHTDDEQSDEGTNVIDLSATSVRRKTDPA